MIIFFRSYLNFFPISMARILFVVSHGETDKREWTAVVSPIRFDRISTSLSLTILWDLVTLGIDDLSRELL